MKLQVIGKRKIYKLKLKQMIKLLKRLNIAVCIVSRVSCLNLELVCFNIWLALISELM